MMTFHPTKDVMKSGAGELPNILHPFISLWAARTSAGRQLGAGGHADGSRRARRWKPAGTQMGAGGHADGSWRQKPHLRLPLHRLRKISSTKVGTPTPLLHG